MKPKEVLALIKEKGIRAVDLRFMDFPGIWQHFTIPSEEGERDDQGAQQTSHPILGGHREISHPY